jgi:hypothetical protein
MIKPIFPFLFLFIFGCSQNLVVIQEYGKVESVEYKENWTKIETNLYKITTLYCIPVAIGEDIKKIRVEPVKLYGYCLKINNRYTSTYNFNYFLIEKK